MADTDWVVLPDTRTSWRDQTISYIGPAAPDRTKTAKDDQAANHEPESGTGEPPVSDDRRSSKHRYWAA
jgi:hypothetical protein